MAAVWNGKVKSINFLIEQGANLNLSNDNGWSALHYVILSSHSTNLTLKIIRILVENGIDINIKKIDGVELH